MKRKPFLITVAILIFAMNSIAQVAGTFTDTRDGKVYKTVKIGTQTWLAENLAYKADSCCWAYNDDKNNVKIYGYLYNWETAKTVCPKGWHLPTNAEWKTLATYLGGEDVAGTGGKLKEIGTAHWLSPNKGATNECGFTALPGGMRDFNGAYKDIGNYGKWWSSTESLLYLSYYYYVSCPYSNIVSYNESRVCGLSVRCVKD